MFLENLKLKRQNHDQEVLIFIDKAQKLLDSQLIDAKLDKIFFFKKLEDLAKKWLGENAPIDDCDGKRLINKILFKNLNHPYFIALAADSLDYFIQCFEQPTSNSDPLPLISWFEVACICGAKSCIGYMLGKLGLDILKQSKNIIPYAVSSGEIDFTMQMAHLLKSLSIVTNPGPINLYSFGNITIIDSINSLFPSKTSGYVV